MDWPDASFLERDGLVTYVEHNQNGGLLVESPDEREVSLVDQPNEAWPLLAPPDLSTLGGPMLPSSSLFTGTDDDDDFMGDPAGAFALAESEPEWRADAASTPTLWERPSVSSSFLPSGLSLGTPRTLADAPERGPANEVCTDEPHTDEEHADEHAPENSSWAAEPEGLGGGTPTTIRAAATFVPLTFAAAVDSQPSRSVPTTARDEQDEPHEQVAFSPVAGEALTTTADHTTADARTVATAHDGVVADPGDNPNAAAVSARKRLATLFAKVDPSASAPAENPRRAKAIRILAGTSLALGVLLGGYTFLQTKSKTTTPAPATLVSEATPTTAIGSEVGAADSGDLEFGNGGDFSFSEGGDFAVK